MKLPVQLEITIYQKDGQYIAKCNAFPRSKGIGETKQLALEKLSNSVSRMIAKSTKEAIKSLLLSDNYTEVLLDPKSKNKEQTCIFHLNDSLLSTQKKVLINWEPISLNDETGASTDDETAYAQFSSDDLSSFLKQSDEDTKHTMTLPSSSFQTNEGFAFGFPISLN